MWVHSNCCEMGKVALAAALIFFSVISCELVVSPEDESNLSSEYLLDNAEVVSRYQQEGRCPEVQDEVRILSHGVFNCFLFARFPQYSPFPGSNLTLLRPTGAKRETGEKRGGSGQPRSCCRAQIFLE